MESIEHVSVLMRRKLIWGKGMNKWMNDSSLSPCHGCIPPCFKRLWFCRKALLRGDCCLVTTENVTHQWKSVETTAWFVRTQITWHRTDSSYLHVNVLQPNMTNVYCGFPVVVGPCRPAPVYCPSPPGWYGKYQMTWCHPKCILHILCTENVN